MAILTYGVPTGRWGSRTDLANNQTFGTRGLGVCIGLVLFRADGSMFCGHLSCGYQGLPANEAAVRQGTTQLLDAVLGAVNMARAYQMASTGGDPTTTWMAQAINAWFNDHAVPLQTFDSIYFSNSNGAVTIVANNNMTNSTNTIDNGLFEVNP